MENVIVVVLDCLRYDRSDIIWNVLKRYGFSSRMVAIAPAPWTIPSHASMLTGMYPTEHGAHETREKKAGDIEFEVRDNLVNDLRKKGYRTYMFTANAFLTERFGFKDFDYVYFNGNVPDRIYLKPEELKVLTEESLIKSPGSVLISLLRKRRFRLLLKGGLVYLYRKFSEKLGGWPVEKGISKITAKIKRIEFEEPFLLFVNLMELHEPYRSEDLRREYSHQLRYLASKLDVFMKVLWDKGFLKDSIVIVTSDHGQLLGEYGKTGHGIYLYDELIKVPLFANFPVDGLGYISHTNLRTFLLKSIDGSLNVKKLFSEVAFSESFGSYSWKIKVDPEYDRHKVAIFYDGVKGVYDVERRMFEFLTDQGYEDELRVKVERFVKSAKVKALGLKGVKRIRGRL